MNVKPVEFHPDATSEAEDSVNWYRLRSERAAERFLSELEHAVEEIAEARADGRSSALEPGSTLSAAFLS
jgi:plasmid stabilization system protein ParE